MVRYPPRQGLCRLGEYERSSSTCSRYDTPVEPQASCSSFEPDVGPGDFHNSGAKLGSRFPRGNDRSALANLLSGALGESPYPSFDQELAPLAKVGRVSLPVVTGETSPSSPSPYGASQASGPDPYATPSALSPYDSQSP